MPPPKVDAVLAYLADGTPLPKGVDHAAAKLMSQWGVKHALMDRRWEVAPVDLERSGWI
jgi:hypothetical protein